MKVFVRIISLQVSGGRIDYLQQQQKTNVKTVIRYNETLL